MPSVSDILTGAKEYASTLSAAATASVESVLAKIKLPEDGAALPEGLPGFSPLEFTPTSNPDILFQPATFEKPPEPDGMVPVISPITEIRPQTQPTDSSTAPSIAEHTRPSALRNFTPSRPNVRTEFALPASPNYQRPSNPTLAAHSMPVKPELHVPDFLAMPPGLDTLPTLETDVQDVIRTNQSEAFQTFFHAVEADVDVFINKFGPDIKGQMEAISNRLEASLTGGTGLTPAVENAIYERTRGKVDAEARRVRDSAMADMANRGFTLPNGALASMLTQARMSAADNNARAAAEIAVAQGELEQKNLQFAMNTLVGLRTLVVNASVAYFQNLIALNGQSLEYAKSVLTGLIEAYNLGVKRFEMLNEVFKAEIALYDTRAKAATLALDIYRGELAALETAVNVDNVKVSLYKSEIEASTLELSAYKAQVEATISVASLEKLKLELADIEVQTFGLEVQAKEAEWRGFVAEIQGDEARVRAYTAEVEAFKGRVAAFQADIQAQAALANSQAETNQARATAAKAATEVYLARVQAEAHRTNAEISNEKVKLEATVEQIKANLGIDDLRLKYETARMAHVATDNRVKNDFAIARLQANTAHTQTVAQVSSIASSTYSGMAQAAMSGMNVLAAQTETF